MKNYFNVFRLFLIPLGIASAALMAHAAFGIRFNEDFLWALAWVEYFTGGLVWPIEQAIVEPAKRWLHEHGFVFTLNEHWKNVFVLLWLVFSSLARDISSARDWGDTAFVWLWGGICALAAGVLAGTVPLADPAVLWWPIAALVGYFTGIIAWYVAFDRREGQTWLSTFGFVGFLLIACTTFSALAAIGVIPLGNLFFETSPSPGVATFAALVGFLGAWSMLYGISRASGKGDTFWQRWLGSPEVRPGLDICSVLGGAAAIVYVGHLLA